MAGISANLSLPNKKSVIVLPEQNNNIYLSSRNLQGVEVITVSDLNTYTIMKASTLVLTESVVDVLQSTL
jgi:large subunit ribosomal protein L4